MPRNGFIPATDANGRPLFVRPEAIAVISNTYDGADQFGPLWPARCAGPYRELTLVSGACVFVEESPRLLRQLGALPADDDL